jgi:hypothetical protein
MQRYVYYVKIRNMDVFESCRTIIRLFKYLKKMVTNVNTVRKYFMRNFTYLQFFTLYMNTFISGLSALLTKYYSGDQIKKNGIGGACGTYGRQERCIKGFSGEP